MTYLIILNNTRYIAKLNEIKSIINKLNKDIDELEKELEKEYDLKKGTKKLYTQSEKMVIFTKIAIIEQQLTSQLTRIDNFVYGNFK